MHNLQVALAFQPAHQTLVTQEGLAAAHLEQVILVEDVVDKGHEAKDDRPAALQSVEVQLADSISHRHRILVTHLLLAMGYRRVSRFNSLQTMPPPVRIAMAVHSDRQAHRTGQLTIPPALATTVFNDSQFGTG